MNDELKPVWIDQRQRDDTPVARLDIGDIGFLFKLDRDIVEYRLLDHPATLMDGKGTKVLFGDQCHTYEQGSYRGSALGMARVTRIARNGRLQLTPLDPTDYPAAMEELGYPDLTPEQTI